MQICNNVDYMWVAQKVMPMPFSAVNIYSKVMKITHIEVRFVSKPYFSTKSPSTSTALRK
jgi:hypothetical protein